MSDRPTTLAEATDDLLYIGKSDKWPGDVLVVSLPGGHEDETPLTNPLYTPYSRALVMRKLAASTGDLPETECHRLFERTLQFLDDYLRKHHWDGYCESCGSVAHTCHEPVNCGHTPNPDCPEYAKYLVGDKARGFGKCSVCGTVHRFYSPSKPPATVFTDVATLAAR